MNTRSVSLHKLNPFWILLICLWHSYSVGAQEVALDPVTITSSLLEKRASESGRNIQIIRGDYFSKLPVNSLDELLRYIPGVEVQARGPMGAQSDIVLRGGTFQQVLVVLDGLRLNDPNTGHFNSYIPIAPSEIERIEVLKGASSAIYGSDAVGGVIYIISKSYAAKLDGTNETQASASLGAGQYGLWQGSAGAALKRDKLMIAGGGVINRATGVPQRGANGYFRNHTASLSARYQLSPNWNIGARSAYDDRDFAAQNFYTTFLSDTASERVRTIWNQVNLTYEKKASSFSLDAGYKRVSDEYLYNAHSIRNESISGLWQAVASWKQRFGEKTDMVAGLNYQRKSISSNDRGEHALHQLAPFFLLSHKMGSYLTVSPAIRFDWRQGIGTEAVPQVNLSYRRGAFQLRGSVGKTIRDADFTERFNNYGKALVTGGSVGNQRLKAERSLSYEAGADWFLRSDLKLSATFFQRFQRDLIDYVVTPYADMPRKDNLSTTGSFALAKNIATVNTRGVETDLQFSRSLSDGNMLWLNFGLSWLGSASSATVPSFYVSSHAKFLSNFAVVYQISRFSFSVNGVYKSRAPREATAIQTAISRDYFVTNAKVEISLMKRLLSVYAQWDNVLNQKYSDLLGAKMPGSWLMGGVKVRLSSK